MTHQEHAFRDLRGHHQEVIRAQCTQIIEYAGWILREAQSGNPVPPHWAHQLMDDARRVVEHAAQLRGIHDTAEIFAAQCDGAGR